MDLHTSYTVVNAYLYTYLWSLDVSPGRTSKGRRMKNVGSSGAICGSVLIILSCSRCLSYRALQVSSVRSSSGCSMTLTSFSSFCVFTG